MKRIGRFGVAVALLLSFGLGQSWRKKWPTKPVEQPSRSYPSDSSAERC